jgi:hypothetical protein
MSTPSSVNTLRSRNPYPAVAFGFFGEAHRAFRGRVLGAGVIEDLPRLAYRAAVLEPGFDQRQIGLSTGTRRPNRRPEPLRGRGGPWTASGMASCSASMRTTSISWWVTGPYRSGPRFGYDSPFELFTPSPTRRPAAIRPGVSRRAPPNRGLDRGAMLAKLFLQLLQRTPASLRDHHPHEHE